MSEFGSPRRPQKVKIPSVENVTPKEIARRSKAVDWVLEVRRKIGPVGIAVDELMQETCKERGCD